MLYSACVTYINTLVHAQTLKIKISKLEVHAQKTFTDGAHDQKNSQTTVKT